MSGNVGHARPGRHMWEIPLSDLQVLRVVYGLLWCGSLARLGPPVPLQMIPVNGTWSHHAPQDGTSDSFSFRVKGGLVIELFFHFFPNDGLGSFVGWSIFIFSPCPLGSA